MFIVPMSVTNSKYYNEIVGRLVKENIKVKDFILMVSKENLLKRLDKRGNSTKWTYQQVDRCINAFESNFNGQKINTNDKNIEEVVLEILRLLEKD